jgi:hypothetical protein
MLLYFYINKRVSILRFYPSKGCFYAYIYDFNGVSMGLFVFLNPAYLNEKNKKTINHEYGHYLQHLMFGPLYLLIIGLPSLINNRMAYNKIGDYQHNYYKKYPEKWADKLGGVKR